MNTQSVDARYVEKSFIFGDSAEIGDFSYLHGDKGEEMILMILPCDDPKQPPRGVNISTKPQHPHCWKWDGNVQKPTLTPSLLAIGQNNEQLWHGYLRAGRFVSC